MKVTEKMTKVYNDIVFGGLAWSANETKISFIGETPEISVFKNPFEEAKNKEKSKDKEAENPKKTQDDHW